MNNYSPIGFRMMPPVVKNLLIINLLMYIGTWLCETKFGIELTQYLGLYYPGSEWFKPYQLFTHLFMHANFMHIFSNMFALWMFGTAIENIWGSKRFLFYYLFTGLGAAGLHMLISWWRITDLHTAVIAYQNTPSPQAFASLVQGYIPEFQPQVSDFVYNWLKDINNGDYSLFANKIITEKLNLMINMPTVGASGAVFGILLAFGMLFPNAMIYLYFFFPLKAKYFVILYGFFELYSGVMNQPGDNIAHFAHIGGMLFGIILILYWKKHQFKKFN